MQYIFQYLGRLPHRAPIKCLIRITQLMVKRIHIGKQFHLDSLKHRENALCHQTMYMEHFTLEGYTMQAHPFELSIDTLQPNHLETR